jgi:hypothetical protein
MTKTLASGILLLTIVLGAFGAQAMTSEELGRKAVEPQVHDMCAGATWPQIPAMCLEGGSGREVRYVSAPADAQIASDFVDRFNVAFE